MVGEAPPPLTPRRGPHNNYILPRARRDVREHAPHDSKAHCCCDRCGGAAVHRARRVRRAVFLPPGLSGTPPVNMPAEVHLLPPVRRGLRRRPQVRHGKRAACVQKQSRRSDVASAGSATPPRTPEEEAPFPLEPTGRGGHRCRWGPRPGPRLRSCELTRNVPGTCGTANTT